MAHWGGPATRCPTATADVGRRSNAGRRLRLHARGPPQHVAGEGVEGSLHVLRAPGARLDEGEAATLGEALAVGPGDDALGLKVALAADEEPAGVRRVVPLLSLLAS